jgi:hypothetical protein
MRIARRGFLRSRVLPILGLYPWQCAVCRRQYLVPRRSASYRQTAEAVEPDDSASLPNETLPVG